MKYYILPLIYIFLDQITKFFVVNNIPYNTYIKINDFFSVINVSNTGIAFSLFQNQNVFFIILTLAIISFLVAFMIKHKTNLTNIQQHCFLLIISGGIGNLVDRLFRGAVVDFIDIGYKEIYRWPAFNVADSCVCIGVILFVVSGIFCKTKK